MCTVAHHFIRMTVSLQNMCKRLHLTPCSRRSASNCFTTLLPDTTTWPPTSSPAPARPRRHLPSPSPSGLPRAARATPWCAASSPSSPATPPPPSASATPTAPSPPPTPSAPRAPSRPRPSTPPPPRHPPRPPWRTASRRCSSTPGR